MPEQLKKVKVVMVKGEKGNDGNSGDYSGLTHKPQINGVTLDGNKTSTDLNLIGNQELSMVQSELDARIDTIEAETTEAASGYVVAEQATLPALAFVDGDGNYYLRHTFTLPENAVVLDATYSEATVFQDGIKRCRDGLTYYVSPDGVIVTVYVGGEQAIGIEGSPARYSLKITYAYLDSANLSELTDVRVGVDGTVYQSAGTAVRSQIQDLHNVKPSGSGLTEEVKQAILNCFAHVGWELQTDGQQYYNALEAALYPPAELLSISAVFNQGETVIYDTDSLDTLKQYLTVNANYDDGTSKAVTDYTLSGTLTEGTSTITVYYGEKTATFEVVVTEQTETVVDGTTLTWELGYIDANGNIAVGGGTSSIGGYTCSFYNVSSYQTALVALAGSSVQRNAYYDSNKIFISRALTAESEIPNGAVYARASILKRELGNDGYDGTGTTITLS